VRDEGVSGRLTRLDLQDRVAARPVEALQCFYTRSGAAAGPHSSGSAALRAAAGDGEHAGGPHQRALLRHPRRRRPRLTWHVDAGDDRDGRAGLFVRSLTHVLPQAVLARPRAAITPDITAPTRVGNDACQRRRRARHPSRTPAAEVHRDIDVKTLSGANELYHDSTSRPHARAAAAAQGAGGGAGAAGG
jgi:hypothetical protein